MSMDKSGKWWIGSTTEDIRGFLEAHASDGFEVHEFRLAKCDCGSDAFQLDADDNEGVAKRTCPNCQKVHFLCDSKEFAEDADFQHWKCVECSSELSNVGVGFSLYDDDSEIRWLYVGYRCSFCGVLGCFADWKIGYAPSRHLFDNL